MFNSFFHSVAILTFTQSGPHFVGSGVLLRIEGADYIATAAHVADELSGPVGVAVVKGNEVRGFGDKPLVIVAVKQKDRTYKHGLDLALFLVTENYQEFLDSEGMSFFDLDKNNPPAVTRECFVSGFPAKKNYYDRRKNAYAITCGCYHIQSYMKDPDRVLKIGGDPDFHFALEVKKRRDFYVGSTNERIPELFDLHGMSGGGVWHMISEKGDEIPQCATGIAGIIVEDRDTKCDRQGMAKVVKIEAIYNLIRFAAANPL
jgi:hypothetical protein